VQAAVRNAEFCVARQQANGWFPNCCLSDPKRPLLHTMAYTMQGLVGIGKLTGRKDFICAAQKTADAEARIMNADGFIPGRQSPVSERSPRGAVLRDRLRPQSSGAGCFRLPATRNTAGPSRW